MNMQVGRVETAPAPPAESQGPTAERQSRRASRRLYIPTIVIQRTHKSAQARGLMWLLYIVDAGLLVTSGLIHLHLTFSSGLAWTVLTVEAAGVVMLLLTAALLWQRR
jgi:hypothetical protein